MCSLTEVRKNITIETIFQNLYIIVRILAQ